MNRKTIWTIIIVILILLGIWWIVAANRTDEGAVEAATIEVADQVPGNTIMVERVVFQEGGFVIVRDRAGVVIGVSEFLEEGEHEDIEIELTEESEAGDQFEVVLFSDEDDDEEFNTQTDREVVRPRGGTPSGSVSGGAVSEVVIVAEDTEDMDEDEVGTTSDDLLDEEEDTATTSEEESVDGQ